MNFKELRIIIETSAEAIGMDYYFGTEADGFLNRLTAGELSDVGHCLQHDTSEGIKVTGGWAAIPIRLSLLRQTLRNVGLTDEQEQGNETPREDLRLAMYNKWIDLMAEIDTNTDIQVQDEWTYKYISYGDNVTEGIMVDFNIMIYDC